MLARYMLSSCVLPSVTVFHSRVFHSCIFDALAFLIIAFSVAPNNFFLVSACFCTFLLDLPTNHRFLSWACTNSTFGCIFIIIFSFNSLIVLSFGRGNQRFVINIYNEFIALRKSRRNSVALHGTIVIITSPPGITCQRVYVLLTLLSFFNETLVENRPIWPPLWMFGNSSCAIVWSRLRNPTFSHWHKTGLFKSLNTRTKRRTTTFFSSEKRL